MLPAVEHHVLKLSTLIVAGWQCQIVALQAGVPGNFTLDEAVALCGQANIATLIPHHFGMFAFNTADPASIDAMAVRQAAHGLQPGLLRPDARHAFLLGRETPEIRPAQQQEHDVDRG